ncbi:hypothetical protein PORY_000326 [Pneumocystis oryctolagi]|uniref:Uncharacterized protein n=1 Tax=Pneumocystis oryctolagi TaxID=42067 RepID=A0ACB7CGU0_9ASCO|nr:hypothetical protein PORY_000326 [Pneumocystis oryctolagi]
MTDINACISIIPPFEHSKLYTHSFEKKNSSNSFLKPYCAWNVNKDMSNVSSIFKEKIKWDSLSFKTENFNKGIGFYESSHKLEQNKNKSCQQIESKKHSESKSNDYDLKHVSVSIDNERVSKNCEILCNNFTNELTLPIVTDSQEITYYKPFATEKNNESLSFSESGDKEVEPKFVLKNKTSKFTMSPIARNPFPMTITGKSVISGLSSDNTLLRTCFRAGEALKVFNHQQNSMILYFIEFFGIIKESNDKKEYITYVVGDLFHPLRGPYIYASYYNNHTMFKFQNGEIVRILGIFKKKRGIKNELRAVKICTSTWEEIQRIKDTIK